MPELILEHLNVKLGDPSSIGVWDIVWINRQTHRQMPVKTDPPPPRLQSAWVTNRFGAHAERAQQLEGVSDGIGMSKLDLTADVLPALLQSVSERRYIRTTLNDEIPPYTVVLSCSGMHMWPACWWRTSANDGDVPMNVVFSSEKSYVRC